MSQKNGRLSILCAFIFILQFSYVHCKRGRVVEVQQNSRYFCEMSKMKVFHTASEMQCVHRCAKTGKCQLLNYRDDGNLENCEIFHVLQDHHSCMISKNEKNWKALVYKAFCFHNPCFPCKCISACSTRDAVCHCSSVSSMPSILISFEDIINATALSYTRGTDTTGKNLLILKNGAFIGETHGRVGNVIHLNGIDAGADAGTFEGHPINNPNSGVTTVTLWIRVLSATSSMQTIFGTGRQRGYTGTLMRISDFGKNISLENVDTEKYTVLNYYVGDKLKSWTHIAIVEYAHLGPAIRLHVNGVLVGEATYKVPSYANFNQFTNLIFGASRELFPLTGQYFNLEIDDFAVWLSVLSGEQISYVMAQGYTICIL